MWKGTWRTSLERALWRSEELGDRTRKEARRGRARAGQGEAREVVGRSSSSFKHRRTSRSLLCLALLDLTRKGNTTGKKKGQWDEAHALYVQVDDILALNHIPYLNFGFGQSFNNLCLWTLSERVWKAPRTSTLTPREWHSRFLYFMYSEYCCQSVHFSHP